jgi:hypothetical protein
VADASNLICRKLFHIDTVIKIGAHPQLFLLKAERVRHANSVELHNRK